MKKILRKHRYVLDTLSEQPESWVYTNRLPDGNGRRGCVLGTTLTELRNAGLVEYGKEPQQSLFGWKITELGLARLSAGEG